MRHPIPGKINLGFGFTIQVYELTKQQFNKMYKDCSPDDPDTCYAFSHYGHRDDGKFIMGVFLRKNMNYRDKARWFTHEVGHLYIEWMDQVRLQMERAK